MREGRTERNGGGAVKWDRGGEGRQNGRLAEEREGIRHTSITALFLLYEQLFFLCVWSFMSVKVLSRSSQSQMGCVALSRLWPFIFTQSGFQWLLCCHLAHEGCGFDSLPWASSSVCGLCAVTPPSSHTP